MATILFRQLDPNWRPQRKFDDEFIDIFRSLKYPISLSKAALAAAGSAHTWPTILQALTWLVDLLRAAGDESMFLVQDVSFSENIMTQGKESTTIPKKKMSSSTPTTSEISATSTYEMKSIKESFFSLEENQSASSSQRAFYDYIGEAYACFLAGDDDKCSELKHKVELAFEQRNQDAIRELENIQAQQKEAQARLEAAQIVILPQALARQRSVKQKFEQIKHQNDEIQASAHLAEAQAARQTAALAQAAERLRDLDLSAKSEAQTRDLVSKLNHEQHALEAEVAAASARLLLSQHELKQKYRIAIEKFDQARPLVSEYEARACALQLVPSTARNADNLDLSLATLLNVDTCLNALREEHDINIAAKAANDTASQARDVIKPALNDLTEALERRAFEVRQVLVEKQSELNSLSVLFDDAQQEQKLAEHEAAAAKANYDREVLVAQRSLIDAEREAKSLQSDLSNKQAEIDAEQTRLDQVIQMHAELEEKLSQVQARRDQTLQNATLKLAKLRTHCLHIADLRLSTLATVHAHCTTTKTKFSQRHQNMLHQINQLRQDPVLLPTSATNNNNNLTSPSINDRTRNDLTPSLAALKRDAVDLD
uniref:Kinetochore protein NDC80 n=1 Tax=Aureoumbra lagunensis TaxID=44058 RepID=A0A7S3JTJ1_9STRA